MYKRDLITTEIEKLAQVLARIVGLKKELRLKEAEELMNETLSGSFSLDRFLLLSSNDDEFINWMKQSGFGHEKLNMLTDFLYSELDFEQNISSSHLIARKLNLIYQHLIDEHQIVHMINLGRQKYIQQYI